MTSDLYKMQTGRSAAFTGADSVVFCLFSVIHLFFFLAKHSSSSAFSLLALFPILPDAYRLNVKKKSLSGILRLSEGVDGWVHTGGLLGEEGGWGG